MAVLRYGHDSSVQLDFPNGEADRIVHEHTRLEQLGVPRGEPLADVGAAVAKALAAPLDYPSLGQCVTPVDRVVLALDRGLPQAAETTAAVVNALVHSGVDPDGIGILQTQADSALGAEEPVRLLPTALRQRVTLGTHDPTNRREMAYLAADPSGEAILINRALHEADLVLPLGCLRDERTVGYFGIHGCVYPAFSDTKTQERFRGLGQLDGSGKRHREMISLVDRAAWFLGINFTIQFVPASGGQILHVVAGQSDSVRRQGQRLFHAAWDWPLPPRASLVVAGIEGGAGQQTWENLGRALQAAGQMAEQGGAIAVCCELSAPPGPAVQRLTSSRSRESALRHVAKERPADALAAAQIVDALDGNVVYLLSRLDPSVVESLDMVPLAGHDELARLARRHSSCILLSNAPYATLTTNC